MKPKKTMKKDHVNHRLNVQLSIYALVGRVDELIKCARELE